VPCVGYAELGGRTVRVVDVMSCVFTCCEVFGVGLKSCGAGRRTRVYTVLCCVVVGVRVVDVWCGELFFDDRVV
jgi:hypothetical protein